MISSLKKLTGSHKELDSKETREIRGGQHGCCYECDDHCGTKPGSKGGMYEMLGDFYFPID